MLEWNAFIKPIVYVLELSFAAVVTIGTADRLLFYDEQQSRLRCAFADNIGACSAVISLGSLCMIGGLYVLWKRLSSAFLCDMKYRHDTESVMCLLLSLGWLCVASVVTAFRAVPEGIGSLLRAERRITITFSWLLWVFHIGSVAIAWFAPDEDNAEEPFESINAEAFPVEEYDLNFDGVPPGVAAWPPLGDDDEVIDRPSGPVTPQITDLSRFLEQHDSIMMDETDIGSPQFEMGGSSRMDSMSPEGIAEDELQPKQSIQDLASVWKEIVSADIEAESPQVDISRSMQPSPDPTLTGESTATGSIASQPRATIRRRTVRFSPPEVE